MYKNIEKQTKLNLKELVMPGGAGSQQDSCTERLCEYDDFFL